MSSDLSERSERSLKNTLPRVALPVRTTFTDEAQAIAGAKAKANKEANGVLVRAREDLPTVPDDCEFEAFYAEEHIMGAAGNLLNLTHAGLVLRRKSAGSGKAPPEAMTFQYFGIS